MPPPFERVWLVLVCFLMAGASAWLAWQSPDLRGGWAGLVLFGSAGGFFLWREAARERFRLELYADCFVTRHPLGARTHPWSTIEAFGVWHNRYNAVVCWRLRGEQQSFGRRASGFDRVLPSLYGMAPDDLVALLEAYRSAAAQRT